MKATFTLTQLAFCILAAMAAACVSPEGPSGPPGPQGAPGPQGPQGPRGYPGPEATVIEYENIDFFAPNYSVLLDFGDHQALPSDAVLVYALWDIQTINGEYYEIWRMLPQTTFQNEGILIYNYEHTDVDVELKLEANFNISNSTLGPNQLNDWVIRIVIVPGEYLNGRIGQKVDLSNYQEVKQHFGLPDLPLSERKVLPRPEVL